MRRICLSLLVLGAVILLASPGSPVFGNDAFLHVWERKIGR
jgi:hypothetical protein